jgi:hypothetical protein
MHSRTFSIISAASRHSPSLLRPTTHRAFHTSARTLVGIPSRANAPVKTSTRLATKNELVNPTANKPIIRREEHILAPPNTLESDVKAQRTPANLVHLFNNATGKFSGGFSSIKTRLTISGTGPKHRFNTLTFYALLGSCVVFQVVKEHFIE